jgi:hypothetical protein
VRPLAQAKTKQSSAATLRACCCLLHLLHYFIKQLTGPSSLSEFLKLPAVDARDDPAAAFLSPPSAKELK